MAEQNHLVVCTTCRRASAAGQTAPSDAAEAPRDGLRLSQALAARGIAHDRQECFSACTRGCVITLRGSGRWTYVQGALDPDQDLEAVITMAAAYTASADGVVPWRSRPEIIRKNTIARIPPLEV